MADTGLVIRTVTAFVQLHRDVFTKVAGTEHSGSVSALEDACIALHQTVTTLQLYGYTVQTQRIATNSFSEYCTVDNETTFLSEVSSLVSVVDAANAKMPKSATHLPIPTMISIGRAQNADDLAYLPSALLAHPGVSASADIPCSSDAFVPDTVSITAAASVVHQLASSSGNGFANFQFCASAMCNPFTPFFPVAYAPAISSTPDFTNSRLLGLAVGLQHVDACAEVANEVAEELADASSDELHKTFATRLKDRLSRSSTHINSLVAPICTDRNIQWLGIDTSLAPSPSTRYNISHIFQRLRVDKFGASGTLQLCATLTSVLKDVSGSPLVGYCGLMFPPLEDTGLASDAKHGAFGIPQLLLFSAVCGIGLDTVPLPGDASVETIARIFMDVAALAYRLKKPLSARLFPVPGLVAGDVTDYDSPYLCNTTVFPVL